MKPLTTSEEFISGIRRTWHDSDHRMLLAEVDACHAEIERLTERGSAIEAELEWGDDPVVGGCVLCGACAGDGSATDIHPTGARCGHEPECLWRTDRQRAALAAVMRTRDQREHCRAENARRSEQLLQDALLAAAARAFERACRCMGTRRRSEGRRVMGMICKHDNFGYCPQCNDDKRAADQALVEERDAAIARAERAEAEAAAMREALAEVTSEVAAMAASIFDGFPCAAINKINAALASDAGAALLERLRKAELAAAWTADKEEMAGRIDALLAERDQIRKLAARAAETFEAAMRAEDCDGYVITGDDFRDLAARLKKASRRGRAEGCGAARGKGRWAPVKKKKYWKARALLAQAQRDEALAVLRRLVDALPKCDVCDALATRAFVRGSHRWCDVHGQADETAKWVSAPGPAPEYPRAAPLREAIALLARHGGSK